jgi:ribosome-binding protein aMBF1 (putative translation factor)
MTTTLEAPVESQAPEVAELSEETRKELVTLREGGMTLAELRTRFPQLMSEQIREVLPAGNARERKAKAAKTETVQGTGGRSGNAKSELKPKPEPKPEPASRWVTGKDAEDLAERVLAARQVTGRNRLAELLSVTGSAVWRFENARIRPDEVEPLRKALAEVEKRISEGEFVKAAREPKATSPTKAELKHRVEAAAEYLRTGTKGLSGKAVAEAALALLDPPTQAATESE